jgi:iron complex transport system substrate-binding protein
MKRRDFLGLAAAAFVLPHHRVQAATPARVVSVGGAITESIYALGLERSLIAADTTSTFPAVAERLPRVGYLRALSAEGLLSLAPSLILASEDAGPPAVLAQIKSAGVRWVSLPAAHTAAAPVDKLRAIGAALGQAERAAARIRQFETEWQRARAEIARLGGHPRAVFVMSHGGPALNLAGRDTAADAMLKLAGCVNALEFNGYKAISAESLAAAAPDVIVTTVQSVAGMGGTASLLKRPGMAETPAARNQRVLAYDGLFLLGFGPRLPQAAEQLARQARGLA